MDDLRRRRERSAPSGGKASLNIFLNSITSYTPLQNLSGVMVAQRERSSVKLQNVSRRRPQKMKRHRRKQPRRTCGGNAWTLISRVVPNRL